MLQAEGIHQLIKHKALCCSKNHSLGVFKRSQGDYYLITYEIRNNSIISMELKLDTIFTLLHSILEHPQCA